MNNKDLIKIIECIEVYFDKKLKELEIIEIEKILQDYTYQSFCDEIKNTLLMCKSFSLNELHRIVNNNKVAMRFLKDSGKKTWEEFYSNYEALK